MKRLLTFCLTMLIAASASAQLDDSIGIFFSETEFTIENTNFDDISTPFSAWVVLLDGTVPSVGGYEASFLFDPLVLVLSISGPNGWTNFGDNFNHLVGYTGPVPNNPAGTVLCEFQLLYLNSGIPSNIFMGPSVPSSVAGAGPAISDGSNPDNLVVCNYTSGPDHGGLVATLWGTGIDFPVATESSSFSGLKALY